MENASLSILPDELVVKIAFYLNPIEIITKLRLVSKSINDVLEKSEYLWKTLLVDFSSNKENWEKLKELDSPPKGSFSSWKDCFFCCYNCLVDHKKKLCFKIFRDLKNTKTRVGMDLKMLRGNGGRSAFSKRNTFFVTKLGMKIFNFGNVERKLCFDYSTSNVYGCIEDPDSGSKSSFRLPITFLYQKYRDCFKEFHSELKVRPGLKNAKTLYFGGKREVKLIEEELESLKDDDDFKKLRFSVSLCGDSKEVTNKLKIDW